MRTTAQKYLPAIFVALTICAAAFTYGGVSIWSQLLIGFAALAAGGLCLFMTPAFYCRRGGALVAKVSLLLLLCWVAIQSLFILTGVISVPAVDSRVILFSKIYIWLSYAVIAWTAGRICCNRKVLKFTVLSIVTIATLEAVLGIVSLYTDTGIFSLLVLGGRTVGSFSSGNSFGGFLAVSLVMTLGITLIYISAAIEHISKRGIAILHISSGSDYKIFSAIALIISTLLQVIAIVLSGSRGSLIAAAFASILLLIWFALNKNGSNLTRCTIFITVVLAALMIILLGIGGTYAVAVGRFQELSDTHATALPRLVIWKGVLSLIASFPFGVGLGGFSSVFTAFQPYGFNINRVYHAHNDYLELLAELGLPGMLFLMIALAALIVTIARRLALPAKGNSVWMRRSAFLAVFAALLHASVDFNLSSRPGVAVLFFAVLGIASSRPSHKLNPKVLPSRKSLILRRIVIISMIIPFVFQQIRFASASVLMRRGFAALGGTPPIYFMLPSPSLTSEEALDELKLAVRIMPEYSHAHLMLGRGRLLAFERDRLVLVNNSLAKESDISAAVINRQISIVRRPQEQKVLEDAYDDLQAALKLSPASVDAGAHFARVLGRLAYISESQQKYNLYLQELLDVSRTLTSRAPHDVTINHLIFMALARSCQSPFYDSSPTNKIELHENIQTGGIHLLRLNAAMVNDVITEFTKLNIEPEVLLKKETVPLPVIWKIYQHYSLHSDSENALLSLQSLSLALDDRERHSLSFNPDVIDAQRRRYKAKLILEQCRWQLRVRDFSKYMQMSSLRTDTLREYVDDHLRKLSVKDASGSRFRYLTLDRLRNGRGIDPAHIQECYELAEMSGAGRKKLNSILSPNLFFFGKNRNPPQYIYSDSSVAVRHRLELLKVESAIGSGDYESAKRILSDVFEGYPLDPDIAAFVIQNSPRLGFSNEMFNKAVLRLKNIMPQHYVGMQLMGGRIEFTGITATPGMVSTFWRFRSAVSSDVQVRLVLRDSRNKTVYSRSVNFTKSHPVEFGNGNPSLGQIFKVDFKLPESVSKSSRLIVGLRSKSTGKFLLSEEGLPYLECYDRMDLIENRHIFRNQTSPPVDVCSAFDIDKLLPQQKFSHNLHNIFDDPAFYPLIGGERRKTVPSTWQPCLSAPGIVEHAVAVARTAFDTNPNLTMFPLGINDGQDWCECDACRLLCPVAERNHPASQRWWSEPYWSFVNKVAAEIEKSCPDKRIGAIAYSSVVKPPAFNLHSNVTVYVCQDAGSHFDAVERVRDAKRLKDWNRICSDVGIYNYAGLASWLFPRYCRDELAADIRRASEIGITKFYIEDSWVKGLDGPLPWIVQKLIENPQLDAKALQSEYCRYAFGPAAETMDLYFDYLQEIWQSPQSGRWFDGLFEIDEQAVRYPSAVRARMYEYLRNAKKSASGNKAVLIRINKVAAPLQLSEAFASEYDLMQKLKKSITSIFELKESEKILQDLRSSIVSRNEILDNISNMPWGNSAMRALHASECGTTLERWNNKERDLIDGVFEKNRVIRNTLKNIGNKYHPPGKQK